MKQFLIFSDISRLQHFLWAIPIGMLLTILCVLGVATGMEFKDRQWGGRWDWADWACTMFGGLVGQCVQLLVIVVLWK